MLSRVLASFRFHFSGYANSLRQFIATHRPKKARLKTGPYESFSAARRVRGTETFPPLYAQLGMPVLEACLEVSAESSEIPKLDSLPNFAHGVKVKVDVVVGVQDRRQQLIRKIEMPQVSPRISPANGASAGLIQRPRIFGILRILDQHAPLRSEQATMPCAACRQHAIHHVHAESDVIRNLLGLAHAHQVTRPILRQFRGNFAGHFASNAVRLPDGQTANRVTRKIELQKCVGIFAPQISARAALYDAEEHLPRWIALRCEMFLRAARPPKRAQRRLCRAGSIRRRFNTFI